MDAHNFHAGGLLQIMFALNHEIDSSHRIPAFRIENPVDQTPARVDLPPWEFQVFNLVHAIQAGVEKFMWRQG